MNARFLIYNRQQMYYLYISVAKESKKEKSKKKFKEFDKKEMDGSDMGAFIDYEVSRLESSKGAVVVVIVW